MVSFALGLVKQTINADSGVVSSLKGRSISVVENIDIVTVVIFTFCGPLGLYGSTLI